METLGWDAALCLDRIEDLTVKLSPRIEKALAGGQDLQGPERGVFLKMHSSRTPLLSSDSRNSNKWLRLGGSGSCHCYRLLVLAMQA